MSFDRPALNNAFRSGQSFPFPLWSDEARELALFFGAAASAEAGYASRITVVLDEQGRWLLTYPSVNVSTHAETVLADCTTLWGI